MMEKSCATLQLKRPPGLVGRLRPRQQIILGEPRLEIAAVDGGGITSLLLHIAKNAAEEGRPILFLHDATDPIAGRALLQLGFGNDNSGSHTVMRSLPNPLCSQNADMDQVFRPYIDLVKAFVQTFPGVMVIVDKRVCASGPRSNNMLADAIEEAIKPYDAQIISAGFNPSRQDAHPVILGRMYDHREIMPFMGEDIVRDLMMLDRGEYILCRGTGSDRKASRFAIDVSHDHPGKTD
ncbi:MAG: hypothetical protein ABJN42_24760 [Roseibium sp.]|uniref:hypothetical protein n=1 Tax=Roseibium sp. TaxID=1936156 RepID=UPI003297954E